MVSQINLYVAANGSGGLGAPGNATLTIGSTLLNASQYTEDGLAL